MRAARILSCMAVLMFGWAAMAPSAVNRTAMDTQPANRFPRNAKPARVATPDNSQRIDINNISMVVTNTGSFAFDKEQGSSGLEFPKGTGKTAVFAAGLWVGGKVSGATRVAVAEYSDEYAEGAMLPGGAPDDRNKPEYKVYKLSRVYADPAARDAALADYEAGAEIHGAPDVEVQGDGSLNILGDQMTWAVYNDAASGPHINGAGSTPPLGLEVQQTTFAFNRTGALGNTVFISYKIINKGVNNITEMYVSQWSDPDLGGAFDDLVGCDVSRSLGYVYNATNNDGVYLSQPPAVGYDFFRGPTNPAGDTLQMASFNKYINGTDPDDAEKTYNYMKGLNADGSVVINPVTGDATTFVVDGDPVTGSGWLDTSPDDRRLMLSTGPFEMAPGAVQEVVAAIIVAQSSNRLSSIALLKFYDSIAQTAFDQNFDLANPPNSPVLIATPEDGAVTLTWDQSAEIYNEPPYAFEGYVVYQGSSTSGPFTRVATYDLVNGIQTVTDDDFDEESGTIQPKVKVIGTDSGLQYSIRLTEDKVRGGPLFSGTPYYYKVTAYSVALGQTPQVLESSPSYPDPDSGEPRATLKVIPMPPPADTDINSAGLVSGPTLTHTDTSLPPGSDIVQVNVVAANQVIDAVYQVGYKPDTLGQLMWYMTRTVGAVTDTVLNNQTNFSGNATYAIIDGLQVKVIGLPLGSPNGALLDVRYEDTPPNPPTYVGFAGHLGLPFFDGSADYSYNLQFVLAGLSSMLNPSVDISPFRNVELRFNGTQKAYQYIQSATAPRTYPYSGYVDVPFTAWDVEENRQLNVALFEFAGAPTAPDGVFNPELEDPDADPFVKREWVEVMGTAYSGDATPDPRYTTTFPNARTYADSLEFMYVLWPEQAVDGSGSPIPPDPGDRIVFQRFSRPATDVFTFTTQEANRSNVAVGEAQMKRIKAVPNPYFNHSTYELNQFNREIKFTHLPARCTVRIFNLAGDLVRTLEKNDTSSQLIWDIETTRGLPVASGIYIFHVDAPGIGTHVGKMAIFMEKERLNTF